WVCGVSTALTTTSLIWIRGFSTAKQLETKAKIEKMRTRPRDRAAICIREEAPALATINDEKTVGKGAAQRVMPSLPLTKARPSQRAHWHRRRHPPAAAAVLPRESQPASSAAPRHRE